MIKVKSYIRWGMSTLLLLAVMTAMSSISVFAWSAETKTTNVVTMSSLHAEIVEEYKRPPFVMPGERTDKKVNIRNTGSADALVRVKLDYDSSILIPELNTGLWELHDDGYFYYKEILKSGEITKEPLLNSVTLSEKAGESYQGKELQLLVSAETVQAEGDGPALWKTTYKELQITQPEQQKAEPVKVVFEGKDKGFRSDTKGMDLFSGFKNLQPGTERTQIIQLENTSGDKADFTLRAEAAEQEKMTEDQKKLVEKLLESYAVITVTSGGKVIYEGSASGNLTGSDSEKTMKQNISLGTIAPGKTQEIRVDLKLSEEMDNEYQQLIGKVHWILQAKESEPDPTPISEKESETEPTSIREKE
ncbi:MAG: hypothetical protein Q4B01_01505, partial [Eubacteriales bacterium]|nr:hypothetical protein [Eubacteriales bacterium]